MSKIKKEECIAILENLKEEMSFWEWDEDYYHSGYKDRNERIDWTIDRMNKVIEIVKEHFEQ